jgi:hypothetical protein
VLASWAALFHVVPMALTIGAVRLFLRHLPPAGDIAGWLLAAPTVWIVSTLSVGRWLGCANLLEPGFLGIASVVAYVFSATRDSQNRVQVARRYLGILVAASALIGMLVPPLSEAP